MDEDTTQAALAETDLEQELRQREDEDYQEWVMAMEEAYRSDPNFRQWANGSLITTERTVKWD